MTTRLQGPVHVAGRLTAESLTVPPDTVRNEAVADDAALAAHKLQHQHQVAYSQPLDASAATERRVLHIVRGDTATVLTFDAGLAGTVHVGAAQATVDLKKNGVSVLSAAIVLTSSTALRQLVAGALATAGSVAGDVFEIAVTATAGGGTLGQGLFARLVIREDADG